MQQICGFQFPSQIFQRVSVLPQSKLLANLVTVGGHKISVSTRRRKPHRKRRSHDVRLPVEHVVEQRIGDFHLHGCQRVRNNVTIA